ncbi:hypothetical protein Q3G72_008151 [Acer saccharum]|nr:hypothetical protein Q3G72_008151 [Acer saccharum]
MSREEDERSKDVAKRTLSIQADDNSSSRFNIPRLSPIKGAILQEPEIQSSERNISGDYEDLFYNQTLDHFNYRPESYSSFQQRYVISSKYWGGANSSSPIFAYLGAEAPLDNDVLFIGFLPDNAVRFKALLVYIEVVIDNFYCFLCINCDVSFAHRYYGKSIPFGSREEAFKNTSTLGYFNSAQAIADYAEILMYVKKQYHAEDSPVIVVGGSYGGMLASWFRLKYPHVALGALASSAPILYFDDITPQDGYYSIVTKDFREASETCYQTIRDSWSEIDKVASQPDGLSILSKKFKTCFPLKTASELKDYLLELYSDAAQYNQPLRYPINVICGGLDREASGSDILSKIVAGVAAYEGDHKFCYFSPNNESETAVGWSWQNIKLILQRFGSNIIFSNGLKDPYSSGGVLENISDSVVAVNTVNGSHCLDILRKNYGDPDWLVKQRETEVGIIEGWITKYYADLKELKIYDNGNLYSRKI